MSNYRPVPNHVANLAGSAKFQAASFKSLTQLMHNVIIIKFFISAIILIGAVTISALYNKTKAGDNLTKRKLRYTSSMWFGENSGMMGTMVLLWFPTILFLAVVQIMPTSIFPKSG